MKKLFFTALVFAVIAIMIAACSDNNSGSKPLEKEEYFIILSDSGSLIPAEASQTSSSSSSEETSGYTLMMENVSESVTWFANRPDRAIGEKTTSEFINSVWPARFGAINPNALLDCRVSGQSLEDGMYLTLANPVYDPENDRLTFASVTLHNWTMDEKPVNPLSFDNVKLTLLPNCNNPGQTCWSWAQVSPSESFVPSNEEGKYLLKMNHIYRELYHIQHAPGYGSEIMSTISMETYWEELFQGISPNASLSSYTVTGKLNLVLLTIDNPSYDSEDNTFTYEATVLSGDVDSPEIMNTATLLIDSTGPVDYRKAAEQEYQKLLDAWLYKGDAHTLMWYQGNALDTLIDYIAITQDPKKGSDLGENIIELWPDRKKQGAWWDDFGWWGIAFLNAARNYSILGQSDATEYNQYAAYCLQDRMDMATQVWAMANEPPCIPCINNPPANWYRFEPRFTGGVWNTAFAGLTPGKQDFCNPNKTDPPPDPYIPIGTPGDYCSILTPMQNTVTNGLYLVLNTRYYLQNPQIRETRRDQTLAIYGWFKNWMDVEDKEVSLCPVNKEKPTPLNKIKPSLLNSETSLVRERVGTYIQDTTQSPSCFTGVKWYEQDLSWAGDQGIVLGGLVDILNSNLTEDDKWLLEKARGILDGVKDHMTRGMSGSTHDNLAPEVLRPWTKFDGWGPDDGKDPTFVSPGGFGFGDPDYPRTGDPEYDEVCSCDQWKTEPPCPSEPPKVALDPTTNYIAGPGIFMRYLLYAYKNNKDLRDHIRSNEYLTFLKANADAVAYGTYSCSCKDTIDSGKYNACNMSCQITRLATLNAAMEILTSR
ncbi:MAG: hypothetical protein JRJ02_03205 [Deltaproteobacteria bacterium]|nr:hypothetical protein [Deltaproteobacteria bacterium]